MYTIYALLILLLVLALFVYFLLGKMGVFDLVERKADDIKRTVSKDDGSDSWDS